MGIGRIYETRGGPDNLRWFWSMTRHRPDDAIGSPLEWVDWTGGRAVTSAMTAAAVSGPWLVTRAGCFMVRLCAI